MPKIIYGIHKGEKFDFRNIEEKDRPESPFKFIPVFNNKPVFSVITWQSILVYHEKADIIGSICNFLYHAGNNECCGRCLSGKQGMPKLADIIQDMQKKGNLSRINEAFDLISEIETKSKCSFAPSSTRIVHTFLQEFSDIFSNQDIIKNSNDFFHMTAPCTAECPAHIQIPDFIDQLRTKKFIPALSIIREHMPFAGLCGRICPHPCETVCRRGEIDEPINIMSLKQSAWNHEYENKLQPSLPEKRTETGKRCAVIGAGPAGLSAAYYLALFGHKVDVFDMISEPGGMAAAGIPDYREPRSHIRYEADVIKNLGVNIYYDKKLGKDIFLKDLSKNYDSSLLAIGAWVARDPAIEGFYNTEGAYNGIDYLRQVSCHKAPFENGKVLVIGGGNTAIDCARTAVRFNADVTIVYRRTRAEMPAAAYEVKDAEEEGVNFIFLAVPTRVICEDGKLKGVELYRMKLGEVDEKGRRQPEVIPNSSFIVECDHILSAVGQYADMSFIEDSDNLETINNKTIAVDPDYFTTSIKGIFAAGDCISGNNLVVRAVGDGKRAALMMDRYMMAGSAYLEPNEIMEKYLYDNNIFNYGEPKDIVNQKQARYNPPKLDPDIRRHSFEEAEGSLDDQSTALESRRCLRCKRLGMFTTGFHI